jgi:hypothetical protein
MDTPAKKAGCGGRDFGASPSNRTWMEGKFEDVTGHDSG